MYFLSINRCNLSFIYLFCLLYVLLFSILTFELSDENLFITLSFFNQFCFICLSLSYLISMLFFSIFNIVLNYTVSFFLFRLFFSFKKLLLSFCLFFFLSVIFFSKLETHGQCEMKITREKHNVSFFRFSSKKKIFFCFVKTSCAF